MWGRFLDVVFGTVLCNGASNVWLWAWTLCNMYQWNEETLLIRTDLSYVCLFHCSYVYTHVHCTLQRCELCPKKEGALKRTDSGGKCYRVQTYGIHCTWSLLSTVCTVHVPASVNCELYFMFSPKGWAHVVCALYIPEVTFLNNTKMEPIITSKLPRERFSKVQV